VTHSIGAEDLTELGCGKGSTLMVMTEFELHGGQTLEQWQDLLVLAGS
jgi:hypothetical protein